MIFSHPWPTVAVPKPNQTKPWAQLPDNIKKKWSNLKKHKAATQRNVTFQHTAGFQKGTLPTFILPTGLQYIWWLSVIRGSVSTHHCYPRWCLQVSCFVCPTWKALKHPLNNNIEQNKRNGSYKTIRDYWGCTAILIYMEWELTDIKSRVLNFKVYGEIIN